MKQKHVIGLGVNDARHDWITYYAHSKRDKKGNIIPRTGLEETVGVSYWIQSDGKVSIEPVPGDPVLRDSVVKKSPVTVTTEIERGDESGPFAVDVLTVPNRNINPHSSWMRTSGFDFYPDGKRAAVCTWMGDVWIVEGIDQLEGKLTWKPAFG